MKGQRSGQKKRSLSLLEASTCIVIMTIMSINSILIQKECSDYGSFKVFPEQPKGINWTQILNFKAVTRHNIYMCHLHFDGMPNSHLFFLKLFFNLFVSFSLHFSNRVRERKIDLDCPSAISFPNCLQGLGLDRAVRSLKFNQDSHVGGKDLTISPIPSCIQGCPLAGS